MKLRRIICSNFCRIIWVDVKNFLGWFPLVIAFPNEEVRGDFSYRGSVKAMCRITVLWPPDSSDALPRKIYEDRVHPPYGDKKKKGARDTRMSYVFCIFSYTIILFL